MTAAIIAEGLHKGYGKAKALDGLDLVTMRGSAFGLLGPNGAGKTTLVKILTTLLKPDPGQAMVAGFSVAPEGRALPATFVPLVRSLKQSQS